MPRNAGLARPRSAELACARKVFLTVEPTIVRKAPDAELGTSVIQ